MLLSRLPIAVAPAQQETVASYLTRLASLHGLPLRELWEPISVPRPGGRRRDVLADRLAAVTGHRREHLVRALPELHPAPDWSALRHQPQPGCPRCDARHPGGPVTHLLPHHRYVCTRHRYWIGPPDIDQPATGLARARRYRPCAATPPAAAGPPRSGRRLRRGADRVPVLRPPLGGSAGKTASVFTANGPAAPRSSSRRAPRRRRSAPPGCSRRSIPKPSASQASSPRPHGDTLRPVMPISSDSSPPKSGVASTARTTRATAVTLSPTG